MKKILFVFLALLTLSASAQNNFKVPPFEKFKLKNGLTVFLMEQHEVPLINVSAVFDAGSINDGERYGLAGITADALLFGTEKYTKPQIEEMTDFVGASINTYAAKDLAGLTSSFAAKDQEKLFDIIQQVIMHPVFDKTEFDKHKQRLTQELVREKESPRAVINAYMNAFMFKDFPYATPGGGTPTTIEKLSAADAKAFYEGNYTSGRGAIAIVGDFKAADMKKKVTAMFGSWKTAPYRMVKRVAPDLEFDKSRVLLVDKPDARETTFLIAGKGIDYNSADYVPVLVVNTILGGRFTSWLNDALRVNSGLTYGARSSFTRYKFAGTFSISTFTKNSTTVPAVDMALQVLDSLHKTGINDEILKSAKAYVKGSFPPAYESAGALARLLTDMHIYNFDENYINTFQAKVDGLTTEQTKQIIATYFPKDKLQFVMVGKASEIRDSVKKYGELTEKQIKADGF
ncbi:M16 family metallopeptidase [Dyadobacter psychrophilus]|uniref:Predicted Zn-dependent peptidase n=1 Tax=Dyadobacter psychrophilus TaxID=651661 RepID=A0A1T5FDS7_9BACT|nr:pitrilysin family protein [Dyadobacter psychrophilus]SKB94339.1 Predicted Zn-dependent peptidase [Dyadobacter psychrophilus]